MRGCCLAKSISALITVAALFLLPLSFLPTASQALPNNLKAAIDYAKAHHPTILDAKYDLEKIDYDLQVEAERFYPKLFWYSEWFYEKENTLHSHYCYDRQGVALGPLMHWHWATGTQITGKVGVDITQDLQEVSRLNFSIKQPLLKNRSRKINENSKIQAKIQQDILRVNYEKALEDLILQVSSSYFDYAQAVLTDNIRQNGLEQAKKYLYQVNQLIETGRLAKNEAEQPALYVETQESQKEESKQRRAYSYLLLMRSMGVIDQGILDEPSTEVLEKKITNEIEKLLLNYMQKYSQEIKRKEISYDKDEKLFDYQFKLLDQNKALAKNENKWNMNIEGRAFIREKERQYGVNISLDFPVNDKLKRYQSLYHLEIEQQKIKSHQQLHRYYYPEEIAFKQQDIQSKERQLKLACKRKEWAQKSVETAELKWRVGRITLFELIQLSAQLQQSELDALNHKINLLNTGFDYFKSLGILTQFWTN